MLGTGLVARDGMGSESFNKENEHVVFKSCLHVRCID